MAPRIAISSGHGKYVQGASGVINEVEQARRVTNKIAEELINREIDVFVFHDDTSTSQSENLDAIVWAHNNCGPHDLDISVHFNAFEQREGPVGTEVWYVSQKELAAKLSMAMAQAAGFIDRGAKYTSSLKFLNATDAPAVLLEVCFVDSETDCDLYDESFNEICDAIATVLGGAEVEPPVIDPIPDEEQPPHNEVAEVRMEIRSNASNVMMYVNGVLIRNPDNA
jgi:N-acetylmuramoyl-L-alanine amidase